MSEIIKKNAATKTNMVKILSSLLKCIKMDSTRYAFTEAIISAVAIVNPPICIPATATVQPVKANKPSQTKTYIP